MDQLPSIAWMSEEDRQIRDRRASAIPAGQFPTETRADPSDAEDIAQDVFYELVEANRLFMPIEEAMEFSELLVPVCGIASGSECGSGGSG